MAANTCSTSESGSFLSDSSHVLLRIGPRRLVSQGLDGAAPVPLLELSSGAILDADVSPDDRWLAVATGRPDGALSIRAVPLRGFPVPEAEWVRVAEPGYWVGRPRFSADGRLLYYLANRDGRTCLWAQHLDPATKRPRSDPFPVVHAHRSAMSRWGPRSGWALSVSRSRLVFNAAEMGGNVYTGMLGFVSE